MVQPGKGAVLVEVKNPVLFAHWAELMVGGAPTETYMYLVLVQMGGYLFMASAFKRFQSYTHKLADFNCVVREM